MNPKRHEERSPYGDFNAPLREPNKRKVDILVGICSCQKALEKRKAVRDAWLRHDLPGIACRFFLGGKKPLAEEDDAVVLDVRDGYWQLPEKVLAFFRYALEHFDFRWLFKCDDDTYLDLERLPSLCDDKYGLIGDYLVRKRKSPSGGAGYFLSREVVEKIAVRTDIPATGNEDVIFGNLAVATGAAYLSTDRLNRLSTPYPLPGNDLVSAHWCSPAFLRAIGRFNQSKPFTICHVKHAAWEDDLLFYAEGYFRRARSGCAGKFRFGGNWALALEWFQWSAEFAVEREGVYVGSFFTMAPGEGQPSLEELRHEMAARGTLGDDYPVRIRYGGHAQKLPGWAAFKATEPDLREPLPWPDASVDAYELESIVERMAPADVYSLLVDVWHTLKPGGVARVSFVDPLRATERQTPEYIEYLHEKSRIGDWGQKIVGSMLLVEERRSVWTEALMRAVLESIGFEVKSFEPGASETLFLRGLENRGQEVPHEFYAVETTCLEARKPARLNDEHS